VINWIRKQGKDGYHFWEGRINGQLIFTLGMCRYSRGGLLLTARIPGKYTQLTFEPGQEKTAKAKAAELWACIG